MRHYEISVPLALQYELPEYLVTETSNSFGDQILILKRLMTQDKVTGYNTLTIESHAENTHLSAKQIRQWAVDYVKTFDNRPNIFR